MGNLCREVNLLSRGSWLKEHLKKISFKDLMIWLKRYPLLPKNSKWPDLVSQWETPLVVLGEDLEEIQLKPPQKSEREKCPRKKLRKEGNVIVKKRVKLKSK